MSRRRGAAVRLGAAALLAPLALAACTPGAGPQEPTADEPVAGPGAAGVPVQQTARDGFQITSPHEASGGTLLEGPTFGPDGSLYLVDVMAPEGEAKVMRVDLAERSIEAVYTDSASAFTSAQFSPVDDRLYLTDFLSGSVVSMTVDGTDPQIVFSGEVEGATMQVDDLTFDPDGNMFLSDTTGTLGPGWVTPGRVVRVGTDGSASVLAEDLPSPNGISFDEDHAGLWVAQYNANRLDYYALDESRTEVVAAYPGIHVDAGRARIDSTAVDADGNIYQAFHDKPEIDVYSSTGDLLTTVVVPGEGLTSATNIAIRPGTTEGRITVSGPAGGYLYTFDALAEGTRQSNGG